MHSPSHWLKRYSFHAFSHGLIWSAIGPLVLHYGDFQHQVFILFVFAGMAAGAIGSRGFISRIFLLEVTPLLIPTLAYLLYLNDYLYYIMASLVVIYYFFLLFIVKNYSQTTQKTIHLLIHNEALVDNLRHSNDELEQSNQRLEEEIEKRKIIEAQLNADKEKAESVGHAKSRFIANMSHEFRTPLNAIIGFGELLKSGSFDQKQMEYIDNIIISSNHLIDLVNDVLDISRIESGKINLSYTNTDIHKLLDETVNITSTSAINKDIVLVKNIHPDLPKEIYIDAIRIKQILLNLINNAIKFTDKGHVKVSAYYDFSKKQIHFEVEDTGKGINSEGQKSLFNAFTQLENFEMSRQEGAGLGLTITRNLSELMGGEIQLTSEEGKGSKFHVQIPVKTNIGTQATQQNNICCYIAIENSLYKNAISNSLSLCGISTVGKSDYKDDCFVISDTNNPDTIEEFKNLKPEKLIKFKPISSDNSVITPYRGFEQIKTLFGINIPTTAKQADRPNIEVSIKVLVADDNRLNRMVIKSFLEDECNIEVIEASDGREALDIALDPANQIDIVLMDIQMPVISGIEATQTIREEGNGDIARVPIIAVTAHAMPEYQKLILSRGFNDCLVKPISQIQLLKTIEAWV